MSVGIVACGAIATHISSIVNKHDLDVTLYPLPPLLHNSPKLIAGEVDRLLDEISSLHQERAVAYADCGTYGALDDVLLRHGVKRLRGDHCYDIFAGQAEIQAIMADNPGTYFLTDFLVRSFQRSVIVELGLDKHPDLRDDYFKNYSQMIWLAQNPNEELHALAQHAADLIGLELEVRNVGEAGLERELLTLLNR